MNDPAAIIEYWFGDLSAPDATIAGRQSSLWWGKDEAVDVEMRYHFEPLVTSAGTGELDEWKATPDGWLALILLTDQVPRNIWRGRRDMYRFDDVARALSAQGIEAGIDQALRPIQRVFFYLPLEHSEDIEDQAWCVDLMRGLARSVPEEQRPVFEGFVEYAEAHHRVIEQFDRFPHRNGILGRDSTSEETEFLQRPGSSF